jgi:hypothetical protein
MKAMLTFFAGILSVIAVGVLLIAYGLLNPRLTTADAATLSRPMYASDRVTLDQGDPRFTNEAPYAARQLAYPVNATADMNDARVIPAVTRYESERPVTRVVRPARQVDYEPRPVRVERAPKRDWTKTAMVIGGSTAAGAGVGAIFGGKKGALIGAALGGGAGTISEVKKRSFRGQRAAGRGQRAEGRGLIPLPSAL